VTRYKLLPVHMPGPYPQLLPVKGGWFAMGSGWAVFGETETAALERYADAERKHAEIDARIPPPAPPAGGDGR
jgi:hypothetical protein